MRKLSLDEFKKYIGRIKTVEDFEDDLSSLSYKFNCTNRCMEESYFSFPTLVQTTIDLIGFIMEDKGDWISYWIYELEYGKKYFDGCISYENGENIKLETVEDLYNFLVEKGK